jgi:hypothetical protein
MKFMINWNIPEDKWLPVLKKWISMSPQERANTGDGVKMIGRWLDMAGRTGVLIVESNDLAAVHRYVGQWNPYMDIDLTPVVDDEESAATYWAKSRNCQRWSRGDADADPAAPPGEAQCWRRESLHRRL